MSISNVNKAKESVEKKENKNSLNEGGDIVDSARSSIEGADTQFEIGAVMGESVAENKGDGDIQSGGGTQGDDEDKIREQLKRDPKKLSDKAVIYFVKKAVHNEVNKVQKEVHDLSSDVLGNAFELSEALKRLKKLKLIMKNIAHWTVKFIRSLFQRGQEGKKFADMPLPQD